MVDLKELFEAMKESFQRDDFVKLTLSKPIRKQEDLQNVYARFVYIKDKPYLSFTYRYKTKDQVVNHVLEEAESVLRELLSESFRLATFFSLQEDVLVMISKKRKVTIKKNPPSFKNKPPEVHDRSKMKRVSTHHDYLKHLGIFDEQGKLIPKMADKYRQINKFLEIVEAQLKTVT